jgi:hypothetical protein
MAQQDNRSELHKVYDEVYTYVIIYAVVSFLIALIVALCRYGAQLDRYVYQRIRASYLTHTR